MGAKRPDIDWDAIRSLYRTDQLSTREIARRYSVSEKLIRLRAKAEGWAKDLAQQVATGVKEAVIRSYSAKSKSAPAEKLSKARAADMIKTAIEAGKLIVLKHQALGRVLTNNSQLLADIIEREIGIVSEMLSSDPNPELPLKDQLMVLDSATRRLGMLAKAHDNLSRAAVNAVGIERQSFSLDDQPADPNAPPSISITYYRSDKVLRLQGGGQ